MKIFDIIFLTIAVVMITKSTISLLNWFAGITEETSNKDKKQMKQIVYKIEKGDLVGDIKGDNIIVILMNGDVNGDINSKEGNVVLIRGDINGDIKANKVLCPNPDRTAIQKYVDKLTGIERPSSNKNNNSTPKKEDYEYTSKDKLTCEDCKNFQIKNGSYYCSNCNLGMSSTISCCPFFEPKNQNKETIIKPNKVIYEGRTIIDLTTTDIESPSDIVKGKIGYLKTGEKVVGTGEFVNKLDDKQYHNCADCGYAKPKSFLVNGIDITNNYDCTKFNKFIPVGGNYCVCDKFIPKEEQNKKCCASCNHYQNDSYNFLKNGTVLKTNGCYTCALNHIPFELENEDPNKICCAYYVKRNPAKNVDSPELPVKTSFKEELKRIMAETPSPSTTIYK